MADMQVEMTSLEIELQDAINDGKFDEAQNIKENLDKICDEYRRITEEDEQPTVEIVKEPSNDPSTICKCFDILNAFLSLPQHKNLKDSTRILKEDFVNTFSVSKDSAIEYRFFKCIILYSLLDKEIAMKELKFIFMPLLVYRLNSILKKEHLLLSIGGIADLLRVYGPSIFPIADQSSDNNYSVRKKNGLRKLYQLDNLDFEMFDIEPCLNLAMDAFLDLVDDEVLVVHISTYTFYFQ